MSLSTVSKVAIGGGIALVAFLATYTIASAAEKPKTPSIDKKDTPKIGETIDISPVKGVQKGLLALGYSVGSTGADDKYGPATESAVKKFNKDNGGMDNGIINNTFRTLLAKKLREKGYTVIGESGPTFETAVKYSSGLGGTTTALTKSDAYNIGCKRGSADGKSEAEEGYASNPKWEVNKDDKTAFEAYTKFKSDFETGYKDCYIKAYNKSKPWYEEGLIVTETGKIEPRKHQGEWGNRQRVLALVKQNVPGRKFNVLP